MKTNKRESTVDAAELAEAFSFMYSAAQTINTVLHRNEHLNDTVPDGWPLPLSADEFATECQRMSEHYEAIAKEANKQED